MKRSDVVVGRVYLARSAGRLVRLRVDRIRDSDLGECEPQERYVAGGRKDRRVVLYDVTELDRGMTLVLGSVAHFLREDSP